MITNTSFKMKIFLIKAQINAAIQIGKMQYPKVQTDWKKDLFLN
jgi:hypothetical protein